MMRAIRALVAVGLVVSTAGNTMAACPDPAVMRAAAEDWLTLAPLDTLPGEVAAADAYCGQAAFVARVAESFGPPIGYKVGFTSKPAQQMMGLDGPVAGVLFAPMLLGDGFRLPVSMARRPMYEADLVVTVGDAAVNDATTPLDAARHLDMVMPFIEVPDMALEEGQRPNGATFIAYDVLPRFGVLGTGVAVEPTQAFVDALGEMAVTVTGGDGKVLSEGRGSALLGHPLEALLWLIRHQKTQGQALQPGDIVSLGSFGAPVPARAGDRITVRYDGLGAGSLSVSVAFVE